MTKSFVIKRISISLLIGFIFGAAVNEISYILLNKSARAPQIIELVIPAGTAERVARGEKSPSIPDSMSFVLGDEFLVKNEDVVDHQLGPLWIPANTSASLKLDSIQSYAYQCSFQPGKYFGLDVQNPLTLKTRLFGISYIGAPLGVLLALYSLLLPEKKKNVI